MAKNYNFTEVVEIINSGSDMEAIADIGRRYPILLHKVSKVAAKAGEDFVDLMRYMPEHLTANKVNSAMKNAVGTVETEDESVEDAEEVKPKKAKAEKVEAEATGSDNYESMSGKELWEVLGKAGKRKDCKDKMGGAKKEDMLAYIKKYGLGETTEADEVESDEAESENPYEGISAPELFKECKKRGLKAAPRKTAKYYIDLLMESDAKVAEVEVTDAEATTESDDWSDEAEAKEEVQEEKKPAKKTAKKPAKVEVVEEEDDDWDI